MTQAEPPRAPDFDAPGLARQLLRTIRAGALATLDPAGGFPLATLTTIATDIDGSPVMLLSTLAAHRANLERDPRASILMARVGKGDPLAHPRLTVTGRAARVPNGEEAARLRTRFIARHPKAKLYVDFADFAFFRLRVESAHLNGGFARAAALGPGELIVGEAEASAFAAFHDDAVAHMNEDHRNAVALYATRLAGAEPGEWRVSGLDPLGVDLSTGDETARVDFPEPAHDAGALRAALVALAAAARAKGS
ncbi:MAG: HugZ family protein [Salinarimonadaceae bacterium]|nr:MAG: HugZ family protein [Salinarimonadaceae bacterium]